MNTIRRKNSNAVKTESGGAACSTSSFSSSQLKVNLYQEIPSLEVALDDFEEYALDRLKVLRKLELLKLRRVDESLYKVQLDPLLAKLKDPIKDQISHFVLRMAYCHSEDRRRWFLTHEVALLKWRLGQASPASTTKALTHFLPEAKLVKPKELEAILPDIVAATPSISLAKMKQFYQVPFTSALDLVQYRQVLVRKGMAYIPEHRVGNLVTQRFRASLSRQLTFLDSVPLPPGMQRTEGFLKNVIMFDEMKDKDGFDKDNVAELNATNVPTHIKHMPLCMAQMQMALEKEKHLKHWSRLQYGLFLKGAGLSLEDALMYFERMFSVTDFQKQYSYMWRHMYGKEGKRANYPAYSCSKIIGSNAPNANEHHGCPYKHGTVAEVGTMLSRLGVTTADQKTIVAQQQQGQFQLACLQHFKAMHPKTTVAVDNLGNHPNAWFHSSVAHAQSLVKDEKKSPPSTAAAAADVEGKEAETAEPKATAVSP